MPLRLILGAIAAAQALAGPAVPLATDWAHITHSELEKIHPALLRAHPAALTSLRATHRRGLGPLRLNGAEVHDADLALPELTLDTHTIESCVGGRVHLNVSSGAGFRRNASDWIGVYSPATADINAVVPIKVATLGNRTHVATGMGGPGPAGYLDGANITLAFDLANVRGSYAFVFFAADGWWTSAGWWEDDPAAAVALASAQPVRLVPHPAAAASYSASPAAASAGVHASSELTSACDDAALRPRVLPHLDPATRAAVPGAWDVVWTGGSGGSSTLYYATSRPQGHALPCAGRGGSGGASVPATVATFAVQDLCGAPATTYGFFRPGQTRTATVVGLLGGTTLYYCMDDLTASDEGPAGGLHTFTAPPDARSSSATSSGFGLAGELGGGGLAPPVTTLAVFGDLGRGTLDDSDLWHQYGSPAVGTARRLAAEADAGTLHGVFHVGDISYSVGYLSAWDYYLDMASAFTSKVPYIINQGNHEYDWPAAQWQGGSALLRPPPMPQYQGGDSGGECGVPTSLHLPLPLWHSTNLGAFHVVAMCTEVNYTRGSPQWQWLLDDLRRVNRSATPWVLFGGHRPLYVDSDYDGDVQVMDDLIRHVEPLLLAFNVSLGLWGHNHAVQRQCAAARGTCAQRSTPYPASSSSSSTSSSHGGAEVVVVHVHAHPPAPVHMVVGTGGAAFTQNAYGAPFNEMTAYKWGYARVTAHNGSYLEWEFVDSQNGGAVLDRMAIWQDPAAIAADIATRNPFAGPANGGTGSDAGGDDNDPGAASNSSSLALLGSLVSAAAVGLLALLWCWWGLAKRAAKARQMHGQIYNSDDRRRNNRPHAMLAQDDGLSTNRPIKPQAFLSSADDEGDLGSSAYMHSDLKSPYNANSSQPLRDSGAKQLMGRLVQSPLQAAAGPFYENERSDV